MDGSFTAIAIAVLLLRTVTVASGLTGAAYAAMSGNNPEDRTPAQTSVRLASSTVPIASIKHGPSISDVKVSSVTPTSATITWTTDVAADSLVFWSGTTDDYVAYGQKSAVMDTAAGVTSHSVVLRHLVPGTTYWFGVRSRASTGSGSDTDTIALWEGNQGSNKFSTAPAPPTGPLDYETSLYGPHHVIRGYSIYIGSRGTMLAGTASFKRGSYKITIGSLPPYTVVHWPLREIVRQGSVSTTRTPGDTIATWSPQEVDIGLATNVGGVTPIGSYSINVIVTTQTSTGSGPTKHLVWKLVVDPATPLTSHRPTSYPKIPNLHRWQADMLTYGAKWCGQTGAPYEQRVWYYDGIRVYQQIRSYTRDFSTWTPCINSVLIDYRDHYVLPRNGAVSLFRQFPRGLYGDFVSTGSADSARAILQIGGHAGHAVSTTYMRESSYGLDAFRIGTKLGGDYPWMSVDVSNLVGMAEQVSNDAALSYQPFMCGLLAEALISYYEDGHQDDVRIPPAIKGMADALWANSWRPEFNSFVYNSFRASVGFPEDKSNVYLNQLIAPMYAWLFRYTGDPMYQVEGDTIWNGAVLANPSGGIGWSGKNFSQNYRWSFDYVKWRSRAMDER